MSVQISSWDLIECKSLIVKSIKVSIIAIMISNMIPIGHKTALLSICYLFLFINLKILNKCVCIPKSSQTSSNLYARLLRKHQTSTETRASAERAQGRENYFQLLKKSPWELLTSMEHAECVTDLNIALEDLM